MATFLLIFLLLFPIACTNNATKEMTKFNTTTAVSIVPRQLLVPRNEGLSHGVALGRFKRDECMKFDAEKEKLRKTKNDLLIAEKGLSAAGHAVTAAGAAAGAAVPIFGGNIANAAKAAGSALQAAGAACGAAALAIDVESRELEYMQCFKKGFDELKKDFNEFKQEMANFRNEMNEQFEKTFKKFDELNAKLDTEFSEIKDQIIELSKTMKEEFKNLTRLIEEHEEKRAMRQYQERISETYTLKTHFRTYTKYLVKDLRSKLFTHCATKDPLKVLNLIKDVHLKDILDQPSSKHYPLLRNKLGKIYTEVMEVAQMVIACFDKISDNKEAQQHHTNDTVKIVQNIITQMWDAANKVKDNLINTEIPAKFPDTCRRKRQRKDAVFETQCSKQAEVVYKYLNDVQASWAEWAVFAYNDPHRKHYIAVLGEAKYVEKACCTFGFMWCERNDENYVRKENAQRFKKWMETFSCSHNNNSNEVVDTLQNALRGSPSMPNSPKFFKGIVVGLNGMRVHGQESDNLIRGKCGKYDYHVCF